MSVTSVVTKGNQARIPDAVVAVLGLKPSSTLVFDIEEGGTVRVTAKTATFAELAGTFPKKKRARPASDAEIRKAVREGAARRFRRAMS